MYQFLHINCKPFKLFIIGLMTKVPTITHSKKIKSCSNIITHNLVMIFFRNLYTPVYTYTIMQPFELLFSIQNLNLYEMKMTLLFIKHVTIAASVEDGGFGRIVDLCLSLGSILVG